MNPLPEKLDIIDLGNSASTAIQNQIGGLAPIRTKTSHPNPPLKHSDAPLHWAAQCTHIECSLHQLSPYIGKLKSVIARDLILNYSKPGDLIVDMFCGSGTIPLEAALLGRRVFASDSSSYAISLTKGKLYAPLEVEEAIEDVDDILARVESLPMPDLRRVPKWVRTFFHPSTLKECLRVSAFLKDHDKYFLFACLLGIPVGDTTIRSNPPRSPYISSRIRNVSL